MESAEVYVCMESAEVYVYLIQSTWKGGGVFVLMVQCSANRLARSLFLDCRWVADWADGAV